MTVTLRVLLVGGPMYDPLYARLAEFEAREGVRVDVAATLPHPALNDRVAQEFGSGAARYDLISTHIKYAPSQMQWLTPLDDDLAADELAPFSDRTLELARIDGALYSLPRNLDVKLLHYRTDSWTALPHRGRTCSKRRPACVPTGSTGLRIPGRSPVSLATSSNCTRWPVAPCSLCPARRNRSSTTMRVDGR